RISSPVRSCQNRSESCAGRQSTVSRTKAAARCSGSVGRVGVIRSINVRVGSQILQHLLALLVVVHQVKSLFVVLTLHPLWRGPEERSIERPRPCRAALAERVERHLPPGAEPFQDLILKANIEERRAGVALATGAAGELAVNPRRLVALRPDHVQSA